MGALIGGSIILCMVVSGFVLLGIEILRGRKRDIERQHENEEYWDKMRRDCFYRTFKDAPFWSRFYWKEED